jgi:hypothetical protein
MLAIGSQPSGWTHESYQMSNLPPPNFHQRRILSELWKGIPIGRTASAGRQRRESFYETVGYHLFFRTTVHVGGVALCDDQKVGQPCGGLCKFRHKVPTNCHSKVNLMEDKR